MHDERPPEKSLDFDDVVDNLVSLYPIPFPFDVLDVGIILSRDPIDDFVRLNFLLVVQSLVERRSFHPVVREKFLEYDLVFQLFLREIIFIHLQTSFDHLRSSVGRLSIDRDEFRSLLLTFYMYHWFTFLYYLRRNSKVISDIQKHLSYFKKFFFEKCHSCKIIGIDLIQKKRIFESKMTRSFNKC